MMPAKQEEGSGCQEWNSKNQSGRTERERERERWTTDESLATKGQEEAEVSQSSMRDKGKEGSLLFRALIVCAFVFVIVLS